MLEEIEKKIRNKLDPEFLEVKNNSHLHEGHIGSDDSGNTHFSIAIKSSKLEKLKILQAHRKINSLLVDEFKSGLHALEIKLIR